jgi:hypothetical protein
MWWTNVALIALLVAGLTIAAVRTIPRRRTLISLLVHLPLAILLIRWAAYRAAWLELALGAVGSAVLVAAWWLAHGRRLGPPRDDNIRVLTRDDPPPS